MRIQLASDLHLEAWRDGGRNVVDAIPVDGDVLVLAGDIQPLVDDDVNTRRFEWFCSRFPRVLYIPGNHEFYGTSGPECLARLERVARKFPNLLLLDRAVHVIDGVRFVGATLWFPQRPQEELTRHYLNDFNLIDGAIPWIHERHAGDLAFLDANIRPGDVVVTHHLPHRKSVAKIYADSPLNRYFVVPECEPLVEGRGAALWLHGHTHTDADYVAGGTRVVCRPMGYPGERRGKYVAAVVEVGTNGVRPV